MWETKVSLSFFPAITEEEWAKSNDLWPPPPSAQRINLLTAKLNSCVILAYDKTWKHEDQPQTENKQCCTATDLVNFHIDKQSLLLSTCCVWMCVYRVNNSLYGLYIKGRFTSAKTASVARQQQGALRNVPLSSGCSSQVRQKQWDRYWQWKTETTADHCQGHYIIHHHMFIYSLTLVVEKKFELTLWTFDWFCTLFTLIINRLVSTRVSWYAWKNKPSVFKW